MKKSFLLSLFLGLAICLSTVFADTAYADMPLYRLYHPGLQVHLYTKDTNEYKVLAGRGWKQEGVAWSTADNQGEVVYRLYNPGLRVHLYTKDTNEYRVLAGRGWQQEGAAYRSHGGTPIYRLYHEGIKKHLYTKDGNEYAVLGSRGWKQEGIAFYGLGNTTRYNAEYGVSIKASTDDGFKAWGNGTTSAPGGGSLVDTKTTLTGWARPAGYKIKSYKLYTGYWNHGIMKDKDVSHLITPREDGLISYEQLDGLYPITKATLYYYEVVWTKE